MLLAIRQFEMLAQYRMKSVEWWVLVHRVDQNSVLLSDEPLRRPYLVELGQIRQTEIVAVALLFPRLSGVEPAGFAGLDE